MKKNDQLESNLLKLFSNFRNKAQNKPDDKDYFIEQIEDNSITVKETDKSGEGQVIFKNSHFTRISTKMIGDNFDVFFNQKKGFSLKRKCDGIFLVRIKGRITLCLVELKKNIDNEKFRDAIQQIEGSYLKTAMFVNLLTNIKKIEIVVFIAGSMEKLKADPDIDFNEKTLEFGEFENNPEAKLKEFSRNKQVQMNFPFFLDKYIDINENYKKKNINVYHLNFDDTFDMKTLKN